MSTYRVTMKGEFTATVAVTAKDEEHAKQLAVVIAGDQRMGALPRVKVDSYDVTIEREGTGVSND